MAQRIIDWSDRVYKAIEANTPLSLGRAARVQEGLVRFVEENLWKNKTGIPNLYLLELAGMYAEAAKEFVVERIESGEHKDFWFEQEHSNWLLYDAVCMPLAQYMAKMHERRQTSGVLAKMVDGHARKQLVMGPPPKQMLEEMLDHCWRDELRAWRFLEGAMDTAARHIRQHGTPASKDLSRFDPLAAYNKLYDYIWSDDDHQPTAKKEEKPLKVWLVGKRFWVAARSRKEAPDILARDTGLVSSGVEGVDPRKKLYDEANREAGTVGDMLASISEPQFIGVAQ